MATPSKFNFPGSLNSHCYTYADPRLSSKIQGPYTNVEQVQSLDHILVCDVTINQDRQGSEHILSSRDARLGFAVDGGAGISHFRLSLTLRYPRSSGQLVLTAVWTAWSAPGAGVGSERLVIPAASLPGEQLSYTFSNRLANVRASRLFHTSHTARQCRGSSETRYWKIRWGYTVPPYFFNFLTSERELKPLTKSQREAIETFRYLNRPDTSVSIVTQKQGLFLLFWRMMTALPAPVPATFPFHTCFNLEYQPRPTKISQFPHIADNSLVKAHYELHYAATHSSRQKERHTGAINQYSPLTFINQKHYKVVKSFGISREMQRLEALIGQRNEAKTYPFRFQPVLSSPERPECRGLYYCFIDMNSQAGQDLRPMSDLELAFPTLGLTVTVTGAYGHGDRIPRAFRGVVVRRPTDYPMIHESPVPLTNLVCILVICDYVLFTDRHLWGQTVLNTSKPPYERALQVLNGVLYNRIFKNALKKLIFAHDPHYDRLRICGQLNKRAAERIETMQQQSHLDESQISVMGAAFTDSDNSPGFVRGLVTLISGFLGAGKTRVSAHITILCLSQNIPIMVFGPLNTCLEDLTDEIYKVITAVGKPLLHNIYRLDLDLGEFHEKLLDANDTHRSILGSELSQYGIDEVHKTWPLNTFWSLLAWIESRTSSKGPFSLAEHMSTRLGRYCDPAFRWHQTSPLDHEEIAALAEVVMWSLASRINWWSVSEEPTEGQFSRLQQEKNNYILGFRGAVTALMRLYISRAHVVLCTALDGARNVQWDQPQYILVEDAAFITESVCLSAIAHHDSATKIILTGYLPSAPILLTPWGHNEFFQYESMSLFERFYRTEFYHVGLKGQYRISLGLCQFISEISNSVWREKNTFSILNPEYVCCIATTIQYLTEGGIKESQILVLSKYTEERRLLREIGIWGRELEIQNALSYAGRGKEIVIWSTTRPGGHLGLGSIADRKLMCLATRSAMDGLIVVGHGDMHDDSLHEEYLKHPTEHWKTLLDWFKAHDRVCNVRGDRQLFEERRRIPNDRDYEQFEPPVAGAVAADAVGDGNQWAKS
ncbi:hypothetical protein BDV06DRAFT_55244 [Aspergillus oleicola]